MHHLIASTDLFSRSLTLLDQLIPSQCDLLLYLLVRDIKDSLLISACQSDHLIRSGIELIQAGYHMTKITNGFAICTDLMEDIVSEQLESIALANFRPLNISIVFRTFIDIAEFAQETGNATVFKLSAEESYVVIIGVKGAVVGRDDVARDTTDKFVNALGIGGLSWCEKPEDCVFEISAVCTSQVLDCAFGSGVRREIVCG
jgi:hypothetical protein